MATSKSGDAVLACAPRYTYFYSKFDKIEPVGTCYLAKDGFETIQVGDWIKKIATLLVRLVIVLCKCFTETPRNVTINWLIDDIFPSRITYTIDLAID